MRLFTLKVGLFVTLSLSGCSLYKPDPAIHPEIYAPIHDVVTTHAALPDHGVGRVKHRTVSRCLTKEGLWIKGCR